MGGGGGGGGGGGCLYKAITLSSISKVDEQRYRCQNLGMAKL